LTAEPRSRRRRWRRFAGLAFATVVVAHGIAVCCGIVISWPFDVALNLGGDLSVPALRAPADGHRRVVVLQHGLWRTPASLGRLERTLRAHGYEVHNPGYPSTRARVEDHAARLHGLVESIHATAPVDELLFVGHSLGGLVIEEYLRAADARPVAACVYLATPHRGALLADLRKHWFLFPLLMGDQAALELSPGDALHQRPIPAAAVSGTIVGDLGEGNAAIPGHDDGTVSIAEASLAGARDSVTLPLSHTGISSDAAAILQVLHFLRHRGFAPAAQAR
jgi:triacylglycerol esterase/lipase EstA (alpha/beta hydrolase family)